MTARDDLDAGLDAGLETHPRWTVAALAAAPWLLAQQGGLPAALSTILLAPWAWAWWSWARGTGRRR